MQNTNTIFQNNVSGVCQETGEDVTKLPLAVMTKMMNSDRLNAENAEAAFKVRNQHLIF